MKKIEKSRNVLLTITTLSATVFSACTMAPKYQTPKAPVPFEKVTEASKKKVAMISWQEYFQSADLQRVIQLALDHNRDLKTAALNIEVAEGIYGVSRSSLLPTINASALETRQGVPSAFASFMPKRQYRANVGFTSYELDLFGRLRSLKEASWQDYLSTKMAAEITKISIISQTANAYTQYLLDRQLVETLTKNVEVQQQRYDLVKKRYENGIDSQTTLLNAEALLESSKTNVETYKKLLAQDKTALMALTGVFDERSVPQDQTINDIKINEDLLDFVPSSNLLLRPDIKQAEANLKSANANIGAARAAFFPTISLTGTYGYGSRELGSLWDNKNWTFTPQITLPIFSGGRNIANLDVANARKNLQIVAYEKTIQTAFKEAADALAERKATVNQIDSYNKILAARQKSLNISDAQHQAGSVSGLDIVDSKIAFYAAQQSQLASKKDLIVNLITLYKVMGGSSEFADQNSKK